MFTRRDVLIAAAAGAPASAVPAEPALQLCIHQTTSAAAGFRRSLEGYSKAGIRYVEVIPPHLEAFVKTDGIPAARRLLSDLNLKAVSSGGMRGLVEPGNPDRPKLLEHLKAHAEMIAELGIDRMVCPCGATGTFTLDDYKRAADNLREAGDIAAPCRVVVMLEFMRSSTFIGTLPTALRVTRAAAHPNVKPVFDFYHFWAGLSKFEDLELLQPGEIHHVHFQDVPNLPHELLDNSTRDIPGDGASPLVRILAALRKHGYHGPLSVELFYPHLQQGDPYDVALLIRKKAEPIIKAALV